ncbi:hypothetical protein [Dyadobacter sp. CY326]|uniref:hypothetical protein n=1 Tax=Dyadobacter sp. CY326 TaxID=2907300 RepID=UPI001F3F5FF2|nr:hypothetical protein [Dyadobacter sp. CY326]MCE7065100.1 hypothetical protein [Dyadobacter sp. CY326]
MKQYFLILATLLTMSACNGQSSAYEEAKKTEAAIKDAPRPGTVKTTSGGWTMTAKVNGKQWTATSIMPPAAAGTIVGYVGGESYLMMYSFEKRSAKVGRQAKLGDGYSVDYWINDGPVYSKYKGIMEITAINGDWVEGKFQFTAPGLTVTDGFYRVQL